SRSLAGTAAKAGEPGGPAVSPGSRIGGTETRAESGKPFTGNVADLIKLSRKINEYQRAPAKLYLALEDTPAADISRLTDAFPWRPNLQWQEDIVFQALLTRWTELDPVGALAWAETLTGPRLKGTRYRILAAWARADFEKALAY